VHYDCSTIKRVEPQTQTLEMTVPVRPAFVNPSNFVQNDPSNPACVSKAHVWAVKCVGCGAIGLSSRRLHVGNAYNNVRVSRTYTPPAQNHLNP